SGDNSRLWQLARSSYPAREWVPETPWWAATRGIRASGPPTSSCSTPCASSFWSTTARMHQGEPSADARGRDHRGERAQIVDDVEHELHDAVVVRARAQRVDSERRGVGCSVPS